MIFPPRIWVMKSQELIMQRCLVSVLSVHVWIYFWKAEWKAKAVHVNKKMKLLTFRIKNCFPPHGWSYHTGTADQMVHQVGCSSYLTFIYLFVKGTPAAGMLSSLDQLSKRNNLGFSNSYIFVSLCVFSVLRGFLPVRRQLAEETRVDSKVWSTSADFIKRSPRPH